MDDQAQDQSINIDEIQFNTFEQHPAGEFRAVFTDAKGERIDYQDGKGPQLRVRLKFQTDSQKENGEYRSIDVVTSPSFSAKGKVRPLLTALGVDVDKIRTSDFKLSAYFGRKLRLFITEEPKKDGAGKKSVINAFLPLKPAEPAKQPVAAGAAPAQDPFKDEDE
jgi:hypothetical protein